MSRNFELLQGAQSLLPQTSRAKSADPNNGSLSRGRRDMHVMSEDPDFDMRALGQKLRKYWRWVFASTLAAVGVAALICVFVPRQYKAESKVEILKQDAAGLSVGSDANTAGVESDSLGFALTLQTQLAVLKADTLAWQVIRELNLLDEKDLPPVSNLQAAAGSHQAVIAGDGAVNKNAAAALKRFKRNLTVEALPGTRLIAVSYTDSDPKTAAKIVNQLVKDFIEYNFQVRYNATAKATDWLSAQLVELKSQVEKSQQRAVQLEKNSGIFGQDEHHNIVLTRLEQLNNDVTSAEADRVVKEALYRISRSGNPETVADMLSTQAGSNPTNSSVAVLNNLRQQEATLSAEYADASSKYGSAYPRLIQIKQRLESVRASISGELANVMRRARNQYEVAASREAAAKKYFADQKAAAASMKDKAVDFLMAKQEADSNRELYQHLQEKLKEAGVLAGLHSSQLQVVDPAGIPTRPSRPNIPLYLAIGGLAGMVLGVFGVFVTDSMDNTMRDVGDIENVAYVPVIGVVPDAALLPVADHALKPLLTNGHNGTHRSLGLHNPAIAEAFRAIRTSLLLANRAGAPTVLMITSGMAQEGKTFTSLNLAAALACNGSKVLLVDADLRRGTLSRALHKHSGPGLTDLLLGSENAAAYRDVDEVPGLTFLPAGATSHGPAEVLGSRQMKSLIERWRHQFNCVLIDTPPVIPVTDAVVISPNVDAVVVVVRFAVTTREAVARTIRVLKDVQAPGLRILVNGMDVRSSDYYHYSGAYGDSQYAAESQLLVPPSSRRTKER